jgi:TrmH family RNA methyltransferase
VADELRSPPITSRKNDRLRLVRSLGKPRARRKLGKFLLEGPKVIEEALRQRPGCLEQLLYRHADPLPGRLAELVDAARAASLPSFAVEPALFDELSDVESPQPVLAVARQAWASLTETLGHGDGPRLVVACCGVQDPGNVGTILRAARFFGCQGVVFLGGSQDPWSPKVVRASAGTLLASPPAKAESPQELLEGARGAGLTPVALTAHDGAPLKGGAFPPRTLLLLGAEGGGLPAALEQASATRLTIQGQGAESLNVAIAAGIALHAWAGAHGR